MRPLRAVVPALVAAGLLAAIVLAQTGGLRASGGLSLAIDVQPEGNTPRSVGTVEDCVSVGVGDPFVIDIVLLPPGIPADRGMAAFQYHLIFDPLVLWVTGDERGQLIDQAPGSNVIYISDPLPDKNGVYVSWAVDFGKSGIEPAGTSESGHGVLARLTMEAQREGVSVLDLRQVQVIDDVREGFEIASIDTATVYVGEPCPGGKTPSPGGADPSPTIHPDAPIYTPPVPTPEPATERTPAPSPAAPVVAPQLGGARASGSSGGGTVLAGLLVSVAGVIMIGAAAARRQNSSGQRRQ